MLSFRRPVIIAVVLTAAFASAVGSAAAAQWYPPAEGGALILGFGAAYPGGTHRGVDIAAAAGSSVAAPAGATVAFAGQVPADGGGTCIAVTLELPDGRKLSLLPLAVSEVVTGESVEAGQTLGQLAGVGDDSSSEPHVHVSLRSGDLYLDPGDLVSSAVANRAEVPASGPCVLSDSVGGEGGGTPAPVTPSSAERATGGSATAAPASAGVTQVTEQPPGVASAVSALRLSVVSCRPAVADAGVPETSALKAAGPRATVRNVPVLVPVSSTLTGVGLACAMIATAVGIGFSRRAHPVRVS